MYTCTYCGSPADPVHGCPGCGRPAPPLAAEIERLDRDISEMTSRDLAIQRERANLSSRMQAALHQRALLQGAQTSRVRRTPRQRRGPSRVTGLLPTTLPGRRIGTLLPDDTPIPPLRKPGPPPKQRVLPLTDEHSTPPPGRPPAAEPAEGLRPEASSRSVQNVLLGLGAMLVLIAAAIFAVYFVTALAPMARVAILVVSSAIVLMVPPLLSRRGLTSTAEWVTTVGLILVPLIGYAVWGIPGVAGGAGLTAAMFAGVVCLATAAIAALYHLATGLTAPRYAALIALQPAVPLLAVDVVHSSTGWALVFAAIAAGDMTIARWLGHHPDRQASTGWLREVTWVLHGVAVGASLAYATVALATAHELRSAVPAAGAVLLGAGIGLAGALSLRQYPLPDVAAGVLTLAIIGSASRVAAVGLPGRALVVIAGAVAVTSAGVRVLPPASRRGPQLAASGALTVLGVVVAGLAVRAAAAPVRAVLPPWQADLSGYAQTLADAVGAASWQVAVSAGLMTVAAVLAVPVRFRRESTVLGASLTALSLPASFGLGVAATPWVLITGAVLIGVTGFGAPTVRSARTHVWGALVVGLVGAAASLAERELTAGVLTALAMAGLVIGFAPRFASTGPYAEVIAQWAQGGAAAALPGAVATTVAAALTTPDPEPVLAASLLAVAGALGYAAIAQVARQRPNQPAALGGTLGALTVAVGAFAGGGALVDIGIAVLLLAGALLLWFAPSIDGGRRADRAVDGTDIAAAAITAGTVGALARAAALIVPGTQLATTAALVFAVALLVRAMPAHWRRGPVLGCGLAGGVVLAVAGYSALMGALQVLVAASPIWRVDLDVWSTTVARAHGFGAQTPLALLFLAAAGAAVLPLRSRSVAVPTCVALAVAGAPAALGLAWWSPIGLSIAVGTLLAMAAVATPVPRSGIGWASAGAALAAYAVGASLVQAWATASALAGVAAAGIAVAVAARAAAPAGLDAAGAPGGVSREETLGQPVEQTHLVPIGGAAVTAALLALPGAVAAAAASMGRPEETVLAAALAASSLGLAVVAILRRPSGPYLTYAAVGTAIAATGIAFAALATGQPFGVYSAAAALLGVLTELLRNATRPVAARPRLRLRRTSAGLALDRQDRRTAPGEGVLTPGLLATAAAPTILALASIGPALFSVLTEPQATLRHVWQGPEAAGVDWTGTADGASVLAALVLTLAAALAAVGFGGRAEARLTRDELVAQVVPVLLPGIGITLLLAPAGLGAGWPAGTTAALTVFTIAMLGVALSPPPPDTEAARPVRVTRWVVLAVGLAAGSAGLAGALATRSLTLGTLAGAVGVGLTAALGGRTQTARVLGWAFAAASAHMFAYTVGLALGLPGPWSAFGVLTVATLTIVTSATLPRLRRPGTGREAAALEWSGYAGALLSLVLAASSLPHLAALLAAVGAVLGVVAVQPSHGKRQRRVLLWSAVACELIAWWLLMRIATIALPEAYTLAFAALALFVGIVELRHHPEVGSWAAYGPALVAAFVPTLAIVLTTDTSPIRRILLLLAAVGTLIAGSVRRQRAPVVIGGIVTTIAALHELFQVSVWLIFIPIGILLLVLGGQYEKRRRDLQRLRGALTRMR